jgi:hypothetical protein
MLSTRRVRAGTAATRRFKPRPSAYSMSQTGGRTTLQLPYIGLKTYDLMAHLVGPPASARRQRAADGFRPNKHALEATGAPLCPEFLAHSYVPAWWQVVLAWAEGVAPRVGVRSCPARPVQ